MTDSIPALLRMTPLRLANVPPPMALHELQVPEVILDSAVNHSNSIFAFLHFKSVSVFKSSNKSSVSSKIDLQWTYELPQDYPRATPIQVCFDEKDRIHVLFDGEEKTMLDVETSELTLVYGSKMNRLIAMTAHPGMGLIEDNAITQLLSKAYHPSSTGTDRPGSVDQLMICRFPSVAPCATFFYHEDKVSSGRHDYSPREI